MQTPNFIDLLYLVVKVVAVAAVIDGALAILIWRVRVINAAIDRRQSKRSERRHAREVLGGFVTQNELSRSRVTRMQHQKQVPFGFSQVPQPRPGEDMWYTDEAQKELYRDFS